MTRTKALGLMLLVLPIAAGCGGDGTGPSGPILDCNQSNPVQLAPGQFTIMNASEVACVRIPQAGASGAEYLYLAVSAAGTETNTGTSTPYKLVGSPQGVVTAAAPPSRPGTRVQASVQPTAPQRFHQRLRELEHALARQPRAAAESAPISASVAPPSLGDKRTFNVLKSATVSGTSPDDYVQVTATVKHVGQKVVIYLDDAAPVIDGYTQNDIDQIGSLFDDELYPIDTTAFGRESDVNSDGLVLVLLTDRVTKLAGCTGGQVVVGFFFAVDLFENLVGSNNAEIFYGLTPDPACSVDRARAVELLPGVFVHEFQHMISYNQHVLVRSGDSEDTWLNEGLSGFAEELGGRQVPDARCVNNDCLTQFAVGDFSNAYDYLSGLEGNFLIGPPTPPLPLTEYGATWLFVRYLGDHFASTQPLATDLTHKLVQTKLTGVANVAAATGVAFDTLVAEWHLANYADDLPQFTPSSDRLTYTSWPFRALFASFNSQDPVNFPDPYPLNPEVTTDGNFEIVGSLPAGSGKHVLIRQPPSGDAVDFKITDDDGASVLPASAVARVAVLRLR
ncbi:MAG TPA: hypothetical protein VFU40_02580 [Gemmatimonadales bacterium]|nr:hypothetical protein [Gemmatimonadales bacterium]